MISMFLLQKILAILFPLLLFLLFSPLAQANLFVEPVRLIFGLQEEERVTGAIQVTNRGPETLLLSANLYDWTLNEQDDIITHEVGTIKETLQGMIRFNPHVFTLEGGATQIVRFTISLPPFQEEAFERRGIIFFEHEDTDSAAHLGATIKTMVGTTIYAIPSTARARFRLLAAQTYENAAGDIWGALLVKNDGWAHIRYQLTYQVVNEKGALLEEGTRPQAFILPGSRQEVYFPLTPLSPGEYFLYLQIQLEGSTEDLNHHFSFQVQGDKR